MTEYLFRNPVLLDEIINTAIEDNTFRSDDLEFTFAARVSLLIIWLFNFVFILSYHLVSPHMHTFPSTNSSSCPCEHLPLAMLNLSDRAQLRYTRPIASPFVTDTAI